MNGHVFVMPLPDAENFMYSDSQTPDCIRNADNASAASCESVKPLLELLMMLHLTSIRHIRSCGTLVTDIDTLTV